MLDAQFGLAHDEDVGGRVLVLNVEVQLQQVALNFGEVGVGHRKG
ncbi:hypothetical protein LGH74_12580 [Hymenobacter sp. BT178]|uniref:Uncharacterized protein n=1 Tax=Hymenobacter lucidus TaxID=2880930 RepID=A0ABS8AVH0_9BACT|nr:hypothetical protein [Hymenobacter lucidus]